jgi:RND family efflux transporter MFP subunit
LAQKKLAINQKLYQIGAIILPKLEESQIEVEHAETQVVTAQREVDLAANELEKTVLRCPVDGVIGTRDAEVGAFVTTQSVIGTVMEVGFVYVELGIIERDIEKLRLGQRVKVEVDSLPNATFEGRIDTLAPVVEGKSRTLTAKVKIENPQGQLLPGMFARADIAVFEKPDALVVPTTALRDNDGDGRFDSVFVFQDGRSVLRPIQLGYLATDYAEIQGGIQEGEPVITEARGELKDGSPVVLLEEEETAFKQKEPEITRGKW